MCLPLQAIRRTAGLTLVELVIGLAVLALLFGLALPAFARYLGELQLLGEARRLSEAVMLARSEAIKRNAHVVLCAASARSPCGSLAHWHEGWIAFVDENANALPDPGEQLLGREGPAADGVSGVGNKPVANYFRFNYLGQARLTSGALQMGTVDVCRPGLRGYHVVLANSGRTRIVRAPAICP